MPFINANGAKFYYELHGSGQPLIFISGYTRDHLYWLPFLDNLSRYFQVLVFDNRGVGQTEDNAAQLTAELMASDVVAIAHELQLKKPHIVGQSMGGTIAQVIASQYPDFLNKLVIVNSSPKWRCAMLAAFKALLTLRENNTDFDTVFELTLPWIFSDIILGSNEKIQMLKQWMLEAPNPQSTQNQARQYNALKTFDGRVHLNKIHAPTLVICGTQDVTALPEESVYMAQQIPNAKLVKFDCAHGISAEAPALLEKQLIEYLK